MAIVSVKTLKAGETRNIDTRNINAIVFSYDHIDVNQENSASIVVGNRDLTQHTLRIQHGSDILEKFKESGSQINVYEGKKGTTVLVNKANVAHRNLVSRILFPKTNIHFKNGSHTPTITLPKKSFSHRISLLRRFLAANAMRAKKSASKLNPHAANPIYNPSLKL